MSRARGVAFLVMHPDGYAVAIVPNNPETFEAQHPELEVVQSLPIFSTVEAREWSKS